MRVLELGEKPACLLVLGVEQRLHHPDEFKHAAQDIGVAVGVASGPAFEALAGATAPADCATAPSLQGARPVTNAAMATIRPQTSSQRSPSLMNLTRVS